MIFDQITNYYFWSIFVAWIISCLIKTIIDSVKRRKLCLLAGFRNGGMPSSHSALMASVSLALFLDQGLSPVFFLAVVLSALIIRDAVTVRREVGLIGDAVNTLLKKNKESELTVVYGHTLNQVLVGLIIGVLSSVIFYIVFFGF